MQPPGRSAALSASPSSLTPQQFWALTVALVVAVVLVYWPAGSLGLMADDYDLMAGSASLSDILTEPFPAGSGWYYRPSVLLTYWATNALGPQDPASLHHVVNVLIHAANTWLVLLLGIRLTARPWAAWAAAWVFALHPANSMDVYWISGRTDTLCTLFYLLGLLSASHYLTSGRVRFLVGTTLAVVGAMTSKEVGATFFLSAACVAAASAVIATGEPNLTRRRVVKLFAATAAATLAVGLLWMIQAVDATPNAAAVDAGTAADNAWTNLRYAVLSVLPPGTGTRWVMCAVVLALAGYSFHSRRTAGAGSGRADLLALGLVAGPMVLTQLPALLFVPTTAPRLLYLPLAVGVLVLPFAARLLGSSRLWLVALVGMTTVGSMPPLVRAGEAWVENYELLERAARSYTRHTDAVDGTLSLFLGFPVERGPTMVFGNDLDETLFFYLHGRQGRIEGMFAVGAATDGVFGLSRAKRRDDFSTWTFQRALPDTTQGWYTLGGGAAVGKQLRFRGVTLTMDSVAAPHAVTGWTLSVDDPETHRHIEVYDFDGSEFVRLRPSSPE